ncbi:hypothetical protein [Pedobacter jeongneungensis]|uniref:hypothetical protein n=1 Tax=Pedobacter jeongneungensis TaxID=947309 RepID=UPI00046A9F37|nr:hypothetical protein [Pedobacter jeongneungensis]
MKNKSKFYLLFSILIALLLGINACRKDSSGVKAEQPINSDLLAAAKQWRQDQLKVVRAALPSDLNIREYNPMWAKARYRNNSNHQKVIGVPMFFSDSSYIEMNVVLIEGKTYGVIKKYHRNDQYKLDVKIFSSTGNIITSGAYDSDRGVMKQPKLKIATLQSLTPMNRVMADGGGIDLEEVTIHGTPPPPTTPSDPAFPVNPIALPGGNNGGGTGTGNGDGGGSGGGTGGNTSGEDSYEFPEATLDKTARPCLQSILLDLKASANVLSSLKKIFNYETGMNNVSAIFEKVATTPGWNVKIGEKEIPDEEDPYTGIITQTNADTYGLNGSVHIDFNKTLLNAGTNLSIARTMIHESMHAYFLYGMAKANEPGYAAFVEANDLLYKKDGGEVKDKEQAQHELIAKKYVEQLAGMLAFYARINNITSPDASLTIDEYCKDLAWGGLMKTKAYRAAPNKSRIESNVLKEAQHSQGSTTKKDC